MKKFKKFLRELWLQRGELLTALAYVITFGWLAYVAEKVYTSDGGLLGKIFFTAWLLVLAFLFLVHKVNNDND